MDVAARTIALLVCSNVFMTFAWYGHLQGLRTKPLMIAVLVSWGIAFFEYVLQVPANRIGFTVMSLPQLKILQEVTGEEAPCPRHTVRPGAEVLPQRNLFRRCRSRADATTIGC